MLSDSLHGKIRRSRERKRRIPQDVWIQSQTISEAYDFSIKGNRIRSAVFGHGPALMRLGVQHFIRAVPCLLKAVFVMVVKVNKQQPLQPYFPARG